MKRGCGWLGEDAGRVVWLAGKLGTEQCPVSYVTGESLAWVEDFWAHEALGEPDDLLGWPARRVDAFLVLKVEQRKLEAERNAGR